MVSRQHEARIRKSAEILQYHHENLVACDHCVAKKVACFGMPNGEGKCALCERRGRPCVSSSWETLDRTSDALVSKIAEDEKRVERLLDELDEVRRRLVRNRKVQEQSNQKEQEKWDCVLREMADTNPPAQFEHLAATDYGLQLEGVLPPFDFSAFVSSGGTPAVGSSS